MARFSNMKTALFFVGLVCFVTIPGSLATMNRKVLQTPKSGSRNLQDVKAFSKAGVGFKVKQDGKGFKAKSASEVQHVKGSGLSASGYYKAVGEGKAIGATKSFANKKDKYAGAKSAGAFKGEGSLKGSSTGFIGGGVKYAGSNASIKATKKGGIKTGAAIKSHG